MINIQDTGLAIEKEINIYHKGYQDCPHGYAFGPFVRDHYLIHFIESGEGVFQTPSGTYHLSKNKGFIIHPNITTYYKADDYNPWSYYWVGFHGLDIEAVLLNSGVTKEKPVIDIDQHPGVLKLVKEIYHLDDNQIGNSLKSKGLLYLLLDEIKSMNNDKQIYFTKDATLKEKYTEMTIGYIKRNFSMSCKIDDIAAYLGIERSHLSRVFNQVTGMSPQEYLIGFRIEKAKELLEKTDLSVGAIGCSVGYYDPYHFSKIFKKITGYTPSEYMSRRESHNHG